MVNALKHAHSANLPVSPLLFFFVSFPGVYYLLSAPAPCPGILRFPPSLTSTTKRKCTPHKDLDYAPFSPALLESQICRRRTFITS